MNVFITKNLVKAHMLVMSSLFGIYKQECWVLLNLHSNLNKTWP